MLLFWKKSKTRVAIEKKAKHVSKIGEQVEFGKSDTCKNQVDKMTGRINKMQKISYFTCPLTWLHNLWIEITEFLLTHLS